MTSPIDLDHMWPNVDRPHTRWIDDAKCKGGDLRQFDPVGRPNKQQIAAKLCSRCPVIRQCAQDALHYKDQGVIRAATFIPNHAEGVPMLPGLIARLERIAGINVGQVAA